MPPTGGSDSTDFPDLPEEDEPETPSQWVNPFTDVSETAWYYNAVRFACENGLFAGASSTTFEPKTPLTRGMLVTVLYHMAGNPNVSLNGVQFSDVNRRDYYYRAVLWAEQNGVASGVGGGKFDPKVPVTREEAVVMLWNFFGRPTSTGHLDRYHDAGESHDWAREALCWAVENNIVSGKGDGVLDPRGSTIRAEAASLLANVYRTFLM